MRQLERFFVTKDTSSGTASYVLPNAVGSTGKVITVKLISGGNLLTITSSGGTIDGATSFKMFTTNDNVTFISDGTDWKIIAENVNSGVSIQGLTGNSNVTLAATGVARTISELTRNKVDPLGQFSNGVFTAARTGRWMITWEAAPFFSSAAAANYADMQLIPSTGVGCYTRNYSAQVNNGIYLGIVSKIFSLTAGDTVTFKVTANYASGSAGLFGTNDEYNNVSILRISN